jgi:hypothetical protein
MKAYLNKIVISIAFFSAVVFASPIEIRPDDESEFVLLKRAEVKAIVNRLIEAQEIVAEFETVVTGLQKKIEQLQKSTNCV